MSQIDQVLREYSKIKKALRRAAESGRDRSQHVAEAREAVDDLGRLLSDKYIGKAVNDALEDIRATVKQFDPSGEAARLIHEEPGIFVTHEMQLHDALGIRRQDLRKLLEATRAELKKARDGGVFFMIPRDAQELHRIANAQVESTIETIEHAKSLPRRKKKQEKESSLKRVALGVFGSGMALGDVALALGGLTAPVAIASIVAGSASLNAAVFDDPKVYMDAQWPDLPGG